MAGAVPPSEVPRGCIGQSPYVQCTCYWHQKQRRHEKRTLTLNTLLEKDISSLNESDKSDNDENAASRRYHLEQWIKLAKTFVKTDQGSASAPKRSQGASATSAAVQSAADAASAAAQCAADAASAAAQCAADSASDAAQSAADSVKTAANSLDDALGGISTEDILAILEGLGQADITPADIDRVRQEL